MYHTSVVSNPVWVQSRGWCGRAVQAGRRRVEECVVAELPLETQPQRAAAQPALGQQLAAAYVLNTPTSGREDGIVQCVQSTA